MTAPVVVKRSVVVAGHRTSISLEDAFWKSLKEIARERGTPLSLLVETIDSTRGRGTRLKVEVPLSAAVPGSGG